MVINDEILHIKDAILSTVNIEKLFLFGSYANGTPTEDSDYDFYMVIPDNDVRPIDAIGDVYMAMRGFKRKPVDILAGTAEVFMRRSQGITLESKIAKEGILLYER